MVCVVFSSDSIKKLSEQYASLAAFGVPTSLYYAAIVVYS